MTESTAEYELGGDTNNINGQKGAEGFHVADVADSAAGLTADHNVKSTFSSRSRHRLPASMIPIETDEDQADDSGGQLKIGHFVMNQSAVPCFLCMSLSNEARARWPGRLTPPWIFRLVLNHRTQFHVQDELRLIGVWPDQIEVIDELDKK